MQWDGAKIEYVKVYIERGRKDGSTLRLLIEELSDSFSVSVSSVRAVYHKYILKHKLPAYSIKKKPSQKFVYDRVCVKENNRAGVSWPPPRGRCNSIIGEPSSFVCCGDKTLPGHSFCPNHEAIYYVKE